VAGILAYADSDGDDKSAVHRTSCIRNIDGYPIVHFNSGGGASKGTQRALVDQTIVDASAGGTAKVKFVMRYHASDEWASGNAYGEMRLSDMTGTFDGGQVDVQGGVTDVASLSEVPYMIGCLTGARP
jgi:hypothetical protein